MPDDTYRHLSVGSLTQNTLQILVQTGWWLRLQSFHLDRGNLVCSDADQLRQRTQSFVSLFRQQTLVGILQYRIKAGLISFRTISHGNHPLS